MGLAWTRIRFLTLGRCDWCIWIFVLCWIPPVAVLIAVILCFMGIQSCFNYEGSGKVRHLVTVTTHRQSCQKPQSCGRFFTHST